MKNPIPQDGFKLDNLKASTKYVDIRVRCQNKVGLSAFSQPVDSVQTLEPTEPSPPSGFGICAVKSNQIDFSWREPFYTGGVPVSEYEMNYVEVAARDIVDFGEASCSKESVEYAFLLISLPI